MPTFYLPTKLNTDYFYYRLNLIPIFTAAYDLVFPPDFVEYRVLMISNTPIHPTQYIFQKPGFVTQISHTFMLNL